MLHLDAEAPVDLAIAAAPPAAGFDEHDLAVCARWMARVAMHLDDALDARATACAADSGGVRSPSCGPSEVGGRLVVFPLSMVPTEFLLAVC